MTLIDTCFLSLCDAFKQDPNVVTTSIIKSAPVLPASGNDFCEEKRKKLGQSD